MSVDSDDARKTKIEGGRKECRTNRHAHKVDDEVVVVEVVLPEHDSAGIANDFETCAAHYGNEVTPCAVLNDKADVEKQPQSEDCEIQSITAE